MNREGGDREPPSSAPAPEGGKPLDVTEIFDLVREKYYPFDHPWEEADAALSDDEAADRRGVQQEFDYLTGALRPDGFADPLGLLRPVFARLSSTNGRPEPIWCPAG